MRLNVWHEYYVYLFCSVLCVHANFYRNECVSKTLVELIPSNDNIYGTVIIRWTDVKPALRYCAIILFGTLFVLLFVLKVLRLICGLCNNILIWMHYYWVDNSVCDYIICFHSPKWFQIFIRYNARSIHSWSIYLTITVVKI